MLNLNFIKDYAREIGIPLNLKKLITEYLQALILKSISESEFNLNISFRGGTCLRFVYNNPRFSDDLDFDLVKKGGFNLEKLGLTLKKSLENYGLVVETNKIKETAEIYIIYVKFTGILYQAELSGHKDEKMIIKVEIDKNPSSLVKTRIQIIDKFNYLYPLLVNDKTTLFAEKLKAVFLRKYTKGRDFFDLIFFLSKPKDEPNYKILQEKNIIVSNKNELVLALEKKVKKVKNELITKDVKEYIFNSNQANLMENYKEIFAGLKEKYLEK